MSRRDSREAAISIIFQNTFTDKRFSLCSEMPNSIDDENETEQKAENNQIADFESAINIYIDSITEEGIKIPKGYDEKKENVLYEVVSIEKEDFDVDYLKDVLNGVIENLASIDNCIIKYSKDWSVERMSKVDLSILRVAIFELLYKEDIPASVTINEAVEIAKKYSHEDASSFINGILGSVYRESNT